MLPDQYKQNFNAVSNISMGDFHFNISLLCHGMVLLATVLLVIMILFQSAESEISPLVSILCLSGVAGAFAGYIAFLAI
jgi:hypothetical protein